VNVRKDYFSEMLLEAKDGEETVVFKAAAGKQ